MSWLPKVADALQRGLNTMSGMPQAGGRVAAAQALDARGKNDWEHAFDAADLESREPGLDNSRSSQEVHQSRPFDCHECGDRFWAEDDFMQVSPPCNTFRLR